MLLRTTTLAAAALAALPLAVMPAAAQDPSHALRLYARMRAH